MFDHLLTEAASVRTVDEFKQWTRESIRPVFPHEMLVCGYGRIHAGGVTTDGIISVDYTIQHLKDVRNKSGGIESPILRRWLATHEPQFFEMEDCKDMPQYWLDSFQRSDVKNTAAHAMYDTERCIGTYHSFHRIPGRFNESHAEALKQLVPIMHEVLCRIISDLNEIHQLAALLATLSAREKEVLQWVGKGSTNSEIANAMFLSEITVKHYLIKIYEKLGVSNRTKLVRMLVEYEERKPPEYGAKLL